MMPDELPDNRIEALVAIEEMATQKEKERLQRAVIQHGLDLTFREELSHLDIAVQVYWRNRRCLWRSTTSRDSSGSRRLNISGGEGAQLKRATESHLAALITN